MDDDEIVLEAELRALDTYQQKHSTCDIQSHPWPGIFGAGFAAGIAWERRRVHEEE